MAAAAGLLAAHESRPSLARVRSALTDWAHSGTTPGPCGTAPACTVSKGLDLFGSLMSLPGVGLDLVDVNDTTTDGNQRTSRDAANAVTGEITVVDPSRPDRFTAPDGVVDMRDFRRFRDAWLQTCLIGPTAGCPALADIDLDGSATHPKKDLNLNGCVFERLAPSVTACPPVEGVYPRFDFNGDGRLTLGDAVDMPFDACGCSRVRSDLGGPAHGSPGPPEPVGKRRRSAHRRTARRVDAVGRRRGPLAGAPHRCHRPDGHGDRRSHRHRALHHPFRRRRRHRRRQRPRRGRSPVATRRPASRRRSQHRDRGSRSPGRGGSPSRRLRHHRGLGGSLRGRTP